MMTLKRRNCLVVALFIVSLTFVCVAPIAAELLEIHRIGTDRWLFGGDVWDEQKTEEFLEVSIPDDAENKLLKSGHYRGMPHIQLRFTASPENVISFTSRFCEGVLHQGYDPFGAIDVYEPYVKTVPIMLNQVGYYSYSLDTPDSVFGNRCGYAPHGIVQFRVNESKPDLYALEFEFNPDCSRIMCSPASGRVVTKIKSDDTPFSMMGVNKRNGQYWQIDNLAPGTVCLEVQSYPPPEETWINALIRITINDEPFPDAKFVEFQRFVGNIIEPTPQWRAFYSLVPATESNLPPEKGSFNYCFAEVFPAGRHEVNIQVITLSGEQYTYEWEIFAR